ncbi:Signal transduction histidine kinase CheA [hydrothermal vent metagenome]|uniref:Chemotaxis protein CheA n=1 Tax=hydrothermal vent metagenome TaxID=652676 RepID=A0A3B1BJA3_9ZZZZ
MPDNGKSALDRMLVKISHLDTLLSLVGEVIITSNNLTTTNRRIQDFYDRQQPLDKISLDMIKGAEVTSNRISSDLHSLVMDIRMVEIKSTFQRFRRAVRDMAKDAGKQVELITIGEDTMVDKTVAEKLYDPINHQVRNAIDHGIEEPLERKRAGKQAMGKLILRAFQRENNVFIEITEDGRGIDGDAIAKAALERGIIDERHFNELGDDEKLGLIYHPGFSTKTTASKISGRGVGMDVVKSNIEELGGEVTIETTKGGGTTFSYRIPQVTAVNILDCLTVRAGDNYYAIPILNVVSTLGMNESEVTSTLDKGKVIQYLDYLVPLYDLNELLGEKPLEKEEEITVVIIESKTGRTAFRVSELLTPEKLVFTPLSDLFYVQGISGTTMISGSKMGLVLDIVEIINRSMGIAYKDESHFDDGEIMRSDAPGDGAWASENKAEGEGAGAVAGDESKVTLSSDIGKEISHRDEFLMELDEMIKSADEQILSLEQNPDDNELINKLFRDFHSMKGNLMMVGFSELGSFVHEVEAILDQARSGDLALTTEIIDILLDSSDMIKKAQQAIVANKAPAIDKGLISSISKFKKPVAKKEIELVDVHQKTFHLTSLEKFNLLARRYAQDHIYQAYLDFKPEYQQTYLVALLILKRITRIGHVFCTVPGMEEIEAQSIGNQIKIMFSTNLGSDDVKKFMEQVLVRHYDVTDYELLQTD